jgi:predicted ATPase/DNA-binding XRE family transcriptional regulator
MRRRTNAEMVGDGGPEFGGLLRTCRLRAGLTQKALAELATVSSRTIHEIECGRARGRVRTVQLLADGLGLTGLTRQAFLDAGRRTPTEPQTAALEIDTDPPPSRAPLFGRDSEVHAMIHILASQRRRAIAVLGLGGVGKSHTVLEVARQLHQQREWPVLWVHADFRLPYTERGRLLAEIRAQLESSSPDISDVCRLIGEHDALLVLDDLTSVAPAVNDLLQEMLSRCPRLRIIVTMRGLIAPPGFAPAVVSPLPFPPDDVDAGSLTGVARVPSVQLLVERLTEVQSGWTLMPDDIHAVVALCRRLDGLPLALEIASHQCIALSLRELASLPSADLIGLSAPAATGEPTSIRDVIASSCALLDETHLSHLQALTTLPATWILRDAEAALKLPRARVVHTLVTLTRLGLVRRQHDNHTSVFQVLNLVREYLRPRATGAIAPATGEPRALETDRRRGTPAPVRR